jgi:hypothetical protein
LSDGDGSFLLFVNGGLHAGADYRFGGKRKMLSLGVYPTRRSHWPRRRPTRLVACSRKETRAISARLQGGPVETEEAEAREAQGLPPVNSFEAVAREWFDVTGGWAPGLREDHRRTISSGDRPDVDRLHAAAAAGCCGESEPGRDRNCASCARELQPVFRYAVMTGRTTASRRVTSTRQAAESEALPCVDPKRLGEFLRPARHTHDTCRSPP